MSVALAQDDYLQFFMETRWKPTPAKNSAKRGQYGNLVQWYRGNDCTYICMKLSMRRGAHIYGHGEVQTHIFCTTLVNKRSRNKHGYEGNECTYVSYEITEVKEVETDKGMGTCMHVCFVWIY